MPQYKIMIAQFPGNNVTHPDVADWVTRTVIQMHKDPRIGPDGVLSFRMASTPITMVRNKAVVTAMKAGVDFLLMVDSDMKPDVDVGEHPMAKPFWPHAFDWALEHGPCNVAAPYCGSPPREAVYVAAFQNWETEKPDACFDWELKPIPRREAALKTGFEQVGALATGLILIDMRVFQKLPPPWFDYDYADETESEMITTEDYFFTRNCGYLGFPQYVFWDAWAGHWKPKLVGRPHVLTTDHVREPFRVACTENLKDDQFVADIRNGVPQVVKPPVNPDEVKARSKKRLAKLKGVPAKRG